NGGRQWIHPQDALLKGHIVYNVKFLGRVEVDSPKGTAVVKDAIRKMKFNKQIRKAEGQKLAKVELTISIDGVAIQEPRLKVIQHRYPLHRISYCADDKSDKRMFTFVAKEGESNYCFVFDSEKCAEEITLTIGQAFDLAYRRYHESTGQTVMNKQCMLLQKKVDQLTKENLRLKERMVDLERMVDPTLLAKYDNIKSQLPVVGRRLENLVLSDDNKQTSNSVNDSVSAVPSNGMHMPVLAPPPPVPSRSNIPSTSPKVQPSLTSQSATSGLNVCCLI
ncbi:hypothetical protein NP493_1029g02000, partial [Ridgeia piscesae]